MGQKAIEIVNSAGVDVKKLIEKLNKAYADEWLAYIQYLTGAQIAVGIPHGPLVEEMKEHAADEFDHAQKLAKRIIELGGTPIIEPKDWYKYSTCGYLAPKDPDAKVLLAQNLSGERCAIAVYHGLLEDVRDKDPITFKLIVKILQDEVEHEQDLEDIADDLTEFSTREKKLKV